MNFSRILDTTHESERSSVSANFSSCAFVSLERRTLKNSDFGFFFIKIYFVLHSVLTLWYIRYIMCYFLMMETYINNNKDTLLHRFLLCAATWVLQWDGMRNKPCFIRLGKCIAGMAVLTPVIIIFRFLPANCPKQNDQYTDKTGIW